MTAVIADNQGSATEFSMIAWGNWWTGKPWSRSVEHFGFKQAKKMAKAMKEPKSPLRAILVALQDAMAKGLAASLVQGVAGSRQNHCAHHGYGHPTQTHQWGTSV